MFLYQGKSFFLRCKDSDYFVITEIFLLFFCFLSIFKVLIRPFIKHIDSKRTEFRMILWTLQVTIISSFDLF